MTSHENGISAYHCTKQSLILKKIQVVKYKQCKMYLQSFIYFYPLPYFTRVFRVRIFYCCHQIVLITTCIRGHELDAFSCDLFIAIIRVSLNIEPPHEVLGSPEHGAKMSRDQR